MSLLRYLAVATAGLIFAAPAAAQDNAEMRKTALTRQWIKVESFFHLNPDCSHVGYPTVRVTSGPSAGSVSIKREKTYSGFAADNSRAKCNASRSPAVTVYYRSNRGFTGQDRFTLELYWTDGDLWTRSVAVDVR